MIFSITSFNVGELELDIAAIVSKIKNGEKLGFGCLRILILNFKFSVSVLFSREDALELGQVSRL